MEGKRKALAERLRRPGLVVAPGVFDLISAKIADRLGFECLYATGYGMVASHLGLPDAGLATYTDMVARVAQIAAMTRTPLVADADTGYGGLLNVQHTVRGYEAAGACALQLEDQEFPKKCGHMLGRRVVAAEDMAAKVRVAVESRRDANFFIVARTDARTSLGLDEALRRGECYLRAGADVLFIESPESIEEMRRIGQAFRGVPLLANMVHGGGRTPLVDPATLQELGYRIAIYPALGFLAAAAAVETALCELKANQALSVPLYDFKAFSGLMGFDWVSEFDRRYRDGRLMQIRDGLIEAIGHTPLIRLRGPSAQTGCEILGKAEFLNPGGSVKDRAGLYLILDAEARGLLKPGGLIVEGTAGNTGIGLTLVGNARGYRTLIVMPQTQSQEKKDMLRLCGAELREVAAVPYKDPNNYVHVSERLASELGAFWANQWDNTANAEGHYRSTGPEIWDQTGGKVDAFTCAIGTGGTLAGVSRFLKERNPKVRVALADPMGAAMYSWFKHRELKSEGTSITEGIGQGRVTKNVALAQVDDAYRIPDSEALAVIFDLVRNEGLVLGGSSGINVAAAIRLAHDLGPGHTVVTILADSGTRYQSKLFNPAFLASKGLPAPAWL